jgi:hypothetical protein
VDDHADTVNPDDRDIPRALRRDAEASAASWLRLEYLTMAWNVVGSVLVLAAAGAARSVALAGFGLDSLMGRSPGQMFPNKT